VFAVGICRLDAGAEGIHLAWNAPELVAVSSPGFDIQRRVAQRGIKFQCFSLGGKEFSTLHTRHELLSPIGTFLYRRGGPLLPISSGSQPWPSTTGLVDIFTLELLHPTNHVRISGEIAPSSGLGPFAFLAIALAAGKAVAVATHAADGTFFTLDANGIDNVAIYTVAPAKLNVCVAPPDSADGTTWHDAPYLVRGLTMPVREADATLSTPAAEWQAASARLVPGDVFSQADFGNLVSPIRLALSQIPQARPGERILCSRTSLDDPYQEIAFANHLSLLEIFPAIRRILGFGYFDRQSSGLVAGETYEYRITGHCRAQDLSENVYDFHTIESQRMLPATFYLRDLRFSFAAPVMVVLDPPTSASALHDLSRRGIQIRAKATMPGWLGPSLDDWDVVIDLPHASSSVTLEMNAAQKFVYAAGEPWAFAASATQLPAGAVAHLSFASPVQQIRLAGNGILFAVRVPSDSQTGNASFAVTTPEVPFLAQPLPQAPESLTISNLQQPVGVSIISTLEDVNPARPPAGFQLSWSPAISGGVSVWPSGTGTAPPIDAMMFQIEHREVTLPTTFGPWEPILPGANISLGTRDEGLPTSRLQFAANLAEVFPSHRTGTSSAGHLMYHDDVFELNDPGGPFERPVPPFGTYHQYRIRTIDTFGRVSVDWTLSNILRFEKHAPPPLPVGPQPEPALVQDLDGSNQFSSPPGVKARVLVAGDPSLSAGELTMLGTHRNAVVLQWGWRANERGIDKRAREFRVYSLLKTPDMIPGSITSVTPSGNGWDLAFTTDRSLSDGECVGQWITSGGYPFLIDSLTGGSNVVVHVEPALANPAAQPVPGPAVFGRPLSSNHQRPASWDSRVAVIPVTTEENYQYIFYDLLDLSADHPSHSIWVGVSAADGEEYVADELSAAVLNGGRPGNESSIVTCAVTGRDHSRPEFSAPPPLGDVPELWTEEPSGRQVLVSLDLSSLIPGALPPGTPIGLDRCSIDTIFGITSLDPTHRVQLTMKDGTAQIVDFPNPADEQAVITSLESANPERMATQYLMYLAAQHSRPDEIFERIGTDIGTFGTVQDRLPPKPGRFFYRVRRADVLGRLSAGGAILPVVVRVPSMAPPAAPEKISLSSATNSVSIAVRVQADPEIAWVLTYSTLLAETNSRTDLSEAELLRIPNRSDLYPLNGLRLRVPTSDDLLAPVAKSLSDTDVIVNADGTRSVTINAPATFGKYVVIWTHTLTARGIASRLNGPFTWGVF